MTEFMSEFYEWSKTLHLIAAFAWLAGLFYLPRLFVYHTKVKSHSESSELFKVMEMKLYWVIMVPAMVVTWIFGSFLFFTPGVVDFYSDIWFQIKLLSVILMTLFQMFLGHCLKMFEVDVNRYSEKFYRVINEIPTILMIIIVIMVIVRPL